MTPGQDNKNRVALRRTRLFAVLCVILCVTLPCLLIYREYHHAQLNHALIDALVAEKNSQALSLLDAGADGSARESGDPVTLRTVLQEFKDKLLHRGASAPRAQGRSALLILYEVRENRYRDRAPSVITSEDLPLRLVTSDMPIEDSGTYGLGLVYLAARNHHHNVLKRLLARRSTAKINPTFLDSALMVADVEDSRVILDCGANVNFADDEKRTPLFTQNPAKIELLLQHGGDIEARDVRLKTPLLWLCGEYYTELKAAPQADTSLDAIRCLLAFHASVKARDSIGATPLLRAASGCPLEIIQAIVAAGADPREVDKNGTTALMIAVWNHDHRVEQWLLKQGLDVNAHGITGLTALDCAEQMFKDSNGEPKEHGYYQGLIKQLKSLGATSHHPEAAWYGEDGD